MTVQNMHQQHVYVFVRKLLDYVLLYIGNQNHYTGGLVDILKDVLGTSTSVHCSKGSFVMRKQAYDL
jgi:hypothetical protein